jgi:hypothetical protein
VPNDSDKMYLCGLHGIRAGTRELERDRKMGEREKKERWYQALTHISICAPGCLRVENRTSVSERS